MPFTENIGGFFNTAQHATAVTIAGTAVDAIFDNEYVSVDVANGVAIESVGPALIFESAKVPAVAQGDAVVVGAVNYTVGEVQPDGTGVTVIRLRAT